MCEFNIKIICKVISLKFLMMFKLCRSLSRSFFLYYYCFPPKAQPCEGISFNCELTFFFLTDRTATREPQLEPDENLDYDTD